MARLDAHSCTFFASVAIGFRLGTLALLFPCGGPVGRPLLFGNGSRPRHEVGVELFPGLLGLLVLLLPVSRVLGRGR